MNKFDRVIATLILLQTRKIIKASFISERFGISLRTVYRDINTLKNAGIPIIGDPGVGYSIMDGYRLPPVMFNEGEATALLTAEKFIGSIADKDTQKHYSNAMTKIRATLRSSEKQSLAILDESISFSSYKHWENKAYLQDLFKCIATKTLLKIHYKKVDGTASERTLEPIGCYHQNHWYLVAFCQLKQAYRTFKMNRIVQLKVLEQQFDTIHISLQDYIDQQAEAWKAQQNFQQIEVAFHQSVQQYVESRKYYFGFVDQEEEEGESIRVKFLNSSLEIVARWLLQFGNKATVLTPLALKEHLQTLSKELYQHHC